MLCKGYLRGLSPSLLNLYTKKLNDFNVEDPYEISFSELVENIEEWPQLEFGDIVNYLVFGTHTFTHQQMKAYKSLEAHNYYTSGWVNNRVYIKLLSQERILMLGEVKHSQSIRATSLKVWLICKKDGEVLTGHCTCMAGMGESCSHVAAFLFLIEAGIRFRQDTSCTDNRNSWLQPYQKDAEFLKIKDIDFQSASSKFERTRCSESSKDKKMPQSKQLSVPEPSDEELHQFFGDLHDAGLSSVVLSVVEPYNNSFVTDISLKKLTNLFCSGNTQFSWAEIVEKCQDVLNRLIITKDDAEKIEKETKPQTKCKKWFAYRTGRITASNMKSVCNTDIDAPAVSIIKNICYPSLYKFSTPATEWGKQHESLAKEKYISEAEKNHANFKIITSGLHINPDYPYIGATPDGKINCDCCSNGIIEIKCPYNNRDSTITEICQNKSSCLIPDEAGNICLDVKHEYYYQIQTQLLCSSANYCDFIVWTNNDFHVERIYPDDLIQETIAEKAYIFFNLCILPELLAKWYTNGK